MLPLLVVVIPWLLIFFQPDLGTSLVLIVLTGVMLYWSQMPIEWILILVFCIITSIFYLTLPTLLIFWIPVIGYLAYRSSKKKIIFSALAISFHLSVAKLTPILWQYGLKEYQKDRLVLFLDPNRDPLGGGYHLIQSQIAIGSGGFFGKGIGEGTLKNRVPEAHTDYIVSVISEEFGVLFIIILMIVFLFFVYQVFKKLYSEENNQIKLILVGSISIILLQTLIHIGVNIRLFPTTGMTLPFISYGGSSIISTSILFTSFNICFAESLT